MMTIGHPHLPIRRERSRRSLSICPCLWRSFLTPASSSSAQPSFLPPKDDLKNLMTPRPQPNSLPSKPQQAHAQPSTSKPPPSTSTAGMSQADLIAQKRAEIQAKIAGWNLGGAGAAGAGATAGGTARPSAMPYSHRPATSSIPTRTAPVAAAAAPAPPPASSSVPGLDPDMARKIAEAKKKVEAMAKKTAVEKNIYLVGYFAIHLLSSMSLVLNPAHLYSLQDSRLRRQLQRQQRRL